jgi:hypothetical protein
MYFIIIYCPSVNKKKRGLGRGKSRHFQNSNQIGREGEPVNRLRINLNNLRGRDTFYLPGILMVMSTLMPRKAPFWLGGCQPGGGGDTRLVVVLEL